MHIYIYIYCTYIYIYHIKSYKKNKGEENKGLVPLIKDRCVIFAINFT